MSTFFEKLTGSRAQGASVPHTTRSTEPAVPTKEEVKRHIRKPVIHNDPKTTHLKVETEEKPADAEVEEQREEEGELTVDIYDKGDSIVIQSTVAGVKPEDLDVSITNDTVTIRGKRECQEEVKEENYYYKELFWGTFARSVILPEEIEEDAAEATLKHGLLTIHLPKKRRGVVQKLKVKVT